LYADSIEFVLVDLSGKNDLYAWLTKNCDEALQSGYLKYYAVDEPTRWHEAIAKNRAVAYTSNEIIVPVDSGFIVDVECTAFILKTFMECKHVVVQIHTQQGKWHPGHLAILQEDFDVAGGYDESLEPVGYHSMDLLNRLKHIGLKNSFYFQNDVDYFEKKPSTLTGGYTYEEYNNTLHQNYITSKRNIAQGCLIANEKSDSENIPASPTKLQVNHQASECLHRLIKQLSVHTFLSDHKDLLNGQSGIALLLSHYSRYNPQDKTVQYVSDKLLDSMVEGISKNSEYEVVSILTSLCYLIKDGFVEPDTSIFEQVDDWLFDAENRKDFDADLGKKVIAGIYMYYRILFSEGEESIIWKERMNVFFKTLSALLANKIYLFRFPVFDCFDLSAILYLCSEFENDDHFKNEIDLIYKDLIPVIEVSMREELCYTDKFLLSWIVKDTRLGSYCTSVIDAWDCVTITDINHFFLYRYLLDLQVAIPESIEEQLISLIQNPTQIDRLLSLLTPATCGLGNYVAGFAWAVIQWSMEREQKEIQ
jgi:hypothetical protein